jgi:hypothetical protein
MTVALCSTELTQRVNGCTTIVDLWSTAVLPGVVSHLQSLPIVDECNLLQKIAWCQMDPNSGAQSQKSKIKIRPRCVALGNTKNATMLKMSMLLLPRIVPGSKICIWICCYSFKDSYQIRWYSTRWYIGFRAKAGMRYRKRLFQGRYQNWWYNTY